MSVRVSYEVENGGDEFWVTGVSPQGEADRAARRSAPTTSRTAIPAIRSDLSRDTSQWTSTSARALVGEVAQSDNDGERGLAGRVDLRHPGERLDTWAYWVKSEPNSTTRIRST